MPACVRLDRIYNTSNNNFVITSMVFPVVIAVIWFRRRLWIREGRISLRAVLIFDGSRIPIGHLVESRLSSIYFSALFFLIGHVVCGVTSSNFHFLSVMFPFVRVTLTPFFLFHPGFDTIWVRLCWHLYHYTGRVPDLIFEAWVLPNRRLTGPLADGRVIFAIREVIVDLDDICVFLRELNHWFMIIFNQC